MPHYKCKSIIYKVCKAALYGSLNVNEPTQNGGKSKAKSNSSL